MKKNPEPYDIQQHSHRLAVWAASSAASASPKCRFSVEKGSIILEKSGFNVERFSNTENLPDPKNIDSEHEKWRELVRSAAKNESLEFTHGIAAKLINCYLKVRFVCGGEHEKPKVMALHPPIDALLLQGLAERNFGNHARDWRKFYNKRWSKFDSTTYQQIIDLIRNTLPHKEPLWKIEEYWKGHQ